MALIFLLVPVKAEEKPYDIIIGLPRGMTEIIKTKEKTVYLQENGEYEITVFRFPASSLCEVIPVLADRSVYRVRQKKRFAMKEYLLEWYCGGKICKADILLDGRHCYAVRFSAKSKACDSAAVELFSTFGLYLDEGA